MHFAPNFDQRWLYREGFYFSPSRFVFYPAKFGETPQIVLIGVAAHSQLIRTCFFELTGLRGMRGKQQPTGVVALALLLPDLVAWPKRDRALGKIDLPRGKRRRRCGS